MSKSSYVRSLIGGHEPKAASPIDYFKVLAELRHCGNNLNQIAKGVNTDGKLDSDIYSRNYADLAAITDELAKVFLPSKVE